MTDSAGNTEVRSGHFEWQDGSTGTIAEYSLDRDTSETLPVETQEIPPDIAELPELYGEGNIHRLQYAMALDSSGELKALYERFASEENFDNLDFNFRAIVVQVDRGWFRCN